MEKKIIWREILERHLSLLLWMLLRSGKGTKWIKKKQKKTEKPDKMQPLSSSRIRLLLFWKINFKKNLTFFKMEFGCLKMM